MRRSGLIPTLLLATVLASSAIASTASASPSGAISSAVASPDWTHGSIAGSVTWDECPTSCQWTAYAVVEASLPEYNCQAEELWSSIHSDPNAYRLPWISGTQSVNGALGFNVSKEILPGVFGQKACLLVVYHKSYRTPTCIAQWEVFVNYDRENGLPPPEPLETFCPLEDHTLPVSLGGLNGRNFTVEQPPSPTPTPTPTLPAAAPTPVPTPAPPPTTPQPLTRAKKLAKALKACKRQPKRKRAVCVKNANRKYGKPKKRRAGSHAH
jgi:hypothetical protein